MNGYIDFNSEILANPENETQFIKKAENILKILQDAKIKTVVSTTKFEASDDIEKYLDSRQKAYNILEKNFKDKNYPKILLGSEVVFSEDIIGINDINKLCIADTKYIMMTLPKEGYSEEIFTGLQKLIISKNVYPVVACIEKYVDTYSIEQIKKLSSHGILMQVSCQAIVNRATRRLALDLLNKGIAQIIGSDDNIIRNSQRSPAELVMDVLNKDITSNISDIAKPSPQYADAVRIMRYNLPIGKYKQIKNNAGMVISNAALKDIMISDT
jgi:protein-tyrosine phosphatase